MQRNAKYAESVASIATHPHMTHASNPGRAVPDAHSLLAHVLQRYRQSLVSFSCGARIML